MTTIGSSAAGEGAEFLDGSKTLVTRFQMPEAGTITHLENYLESYSPPGSAVTYYPVIYRGTSSTPTAVAYSAGATAGLAKTANSHALLSPITHTADEFLWGGFGAEAGVGASYSASAGVDAPQVGSMPPPSTMTPDYLESGFRWSCALVYTPSGGGDTTPDSFTFTDVTNAALSTQYTSNTITVSGIDTAAAISISGGSGTYSINGGSYTASGGTVNNGDTVSVRVTSSGSNSTAVNATLTIGGVSDTYSVTTLAAGATIDSYPAEIRSGQTGIAYTTTGLTSVSGITIGALAATSISDSSGDGTHAIPPLVDETAHELYGTKTVTITGTGGAPTTTTTFLPAAGNDYVVLGNDIDYSTTGIVNGFSPAAVEFDELVAPSALVLNARGQGTGEAGTYLCWHIQASTKIARSYTVTLGVVSAFQGDAFQSDAFQSDNVGGDIYSVTGAGSLTFGGGAWASFAIAAKGAGQLSDGGSFKSKLISLQKSAGSLLLSGDAKISNLFSLKSSAQIVIGGAAKQRLISKNIAAGNISFAGAAKIRQISSYIGIGSVMAGGSAATSLNINTVTLSVVGSGGFIASGAAKLKTILLQKSVGQISAGGFSSFRFSFRNIGLGAVVGGGQTKTKFVFAGKSVGNIFLSGNTKNRLAYKSVSAGGIAVLGTAKIRQLTSYVGVGGMVAGGTARASLAVSTVSFVAVGVGQFELSGGAHITLLPAINWYQNIYLTVYYRPLDRRVVAKPLDRTVKYRF
jgi:hypothetical protein